MSPRSRNFHKSSQITLVTQPFPLPFSLLSLPHPFLLHGSPTTMFTPHPTLPHHSNGHPIYPPPIAHRSTSPNQPTNHRSIPSPSLPTHPFLCLLLYLHSLSLSDFLEMNHILGLGYGRGRMRWGGAQRRVVDVDRWGGAIRQWRLIRLRWGLGKAVFGAGPASLGAGQGCVWGWGGFIGGWGTHPRFAGWRFGGEAAAKSI